MTNTDTNIDTQAKTYRYIVSLSGKGGDFWFFPMTTEQVSFWGQRGSEALTEHVNGGFDEDGTAPEFRLGHYLDIGDQAGGIEVSIEGEVVVRDEGGTICFERTFWELDDEDLELVRVVNAPTTGGLFRTFEKSSQMYDLKLLKPFDHSKLRLRATDTPKGELVHGLTYDGAEIERSMDEDKEYAMHEAQLLS